jgi:hypothetical protein
VQLLHKHIRDSINLVLDVDERAEAVKLTSLASPGGMVSDIERGELIGFGIGQAPGRVSRGFEQLITSTVDDLGGFGVVNAVLIGGDLNYWSYESGQRNVSLLPNKLGGGVPYFLCR